MNWIATRTLSDPETGSVVKVSLSSPQLGADGVWECMYRIEEVGERHDGKGYGEDGCQALSLALEKIRVFLDSRPRSLSWNGMEPGLTGFHRVPTSIGFGIGFVRRLEALIDREVEQFAQEAIARGGPPPDSRTPPS